jgi:hypothetical protein
VLLCLKLFFSKSVVILLSVNITNIFDNYTMPSSYQIWESCC